MKFSYLVVYCKDIEESIEFYRDIIGLEVERRYTDTGNVQIVFMVEKGKRPMLDQPMIELVSGMADESTDQSGKLIGFTVDSVERVSTLIRQGGYPLLKGPYSPDPSVIICEFKGPDGEQVGIMEMTE